MLYGFLKLDKTLFKFIIAGVINTIVGRALIFILYNIVGMGYWLSSGISYILTMVQSFFLSKYFTFAVKKWSLFMIAAFVMNILSCYGIAYGIAKPMMNYILRNNSQKVRENIAPLAGMCLFTGINYLGQRFVVFKSNKNMTNKGE
jgi:putative flippase GtrA